MIAKEFLALGLFVVIWVSAPLAARYFSGKPLLPLGGGSRLRQGLIMLGMGGAWICIGLGLAWNFRGKEPLLSFLVREYPLEVGLIVIGLLLLGWIYRSFWLGQ